MKNIINKKYRVLAVIIIISVVFLGLMIFFRVSFTGNTSMYTLYANGKEVAVSHKEEILEEAIRMSRMKIGSELESMFLADVDFAIEKTEVFYLYADSFNEIKDRIERVLWNYQKSTLNHSYTVKINDYTINLATSEEVLELLYGSLSLYDHENLYTAMLDLDNESELNVLTATVMLSDGEEEVLTSAGIERYFDQVEQSMEFSLEQNFEDFELGLQDIYFANTVEVVEAYLLESQLTSVSVAIDVVTKKMEKEQIYEVVSGDTLSGISLTTNIPLDRLIEINPVLENENSLIRIGDELIVTVPEPELTVIHVSKSYYEEEYEEEIVYVDNDEWYTTTQVTLQQPSAGRRNVVVNETFRNDMEIEREILKEEILMEAVPKIVERGTKIPPTYIKPLSGGSSSSGFGPRSAPTAGASTYHKGHDWSTPTGTSIVASSAGTVSKAGWGSGYGYVIYINHPDGRQTRYAHLSRVLVSAGDYVQQGQKIALSGNTGVSSGPHLHFELLINGVQVNPLPYLN